MTEQELLEKVRRELQAVTREDRPQTAKRCRQCFLENDPGCEKCLSCGKDLAARTKPGRAVACPEAGAIDGPISWAILVNSERRALLGPGGRLVVGRGEMSDVWLENSTVSRSHLELVWEKGAECPRFRDLGSANGTRHRGILRAEGVLRAGDALEVGPYRISFQKEERPAVLKDSTDGIFDAYFDGGPDLHGELAPGTASTLLRALAAAERTGTFEVALERGTGSVVLAAGRVVSARCGRTIGLAALHLILNAERGAYRFDRTFEVDDGPAVNLSVEQVLRAVPC